MVLLTPPAEVTVALSPVAWKVWTRDSAASKRRHPAGLRSGTTRNSIGALAVAAGGAAVAGADVDVVWVVQPARSAAPRTAAPKIPITCRIPSPPWRPRRGNNLVSPEPYREAPGRSIGQAAVLALPAARRMAQGRSAMEKLQVQQVQAMKAARMMAVRP
ncbi:hypothetical protein [Paracoccus pantotrophus]|uniref:hypothetical protein n=1 Tax=Paracoccus pantotrophus TaxID=82367 RepID=UPI0035B4998D